ncbi:COP9 signalosome complex subunit 7 [Hibiscus syriacus]|uniref:COP9 signalosome complex subunit 7 n=1 Tax=Hibiscus syriacus TaxID=106335 RepID=A0A6A2X1J2_HIBSY|nr:COP9 signalosome complex subunit 7 [Hibiscus syriacus]
MDIEQKQGEFIDHFVKQASAQKGTTLVSVIVEATSHPSLFAFSDILAVLTVAKLDGTENSVYLEVLRLFAHGTWSDYKSNSGSLPQLVPDQVLKLSNSLSLHLLRRTRYLDMLPTTFGNPLWFIDDEMLELRGTILYRAAELRKKDLIYVYEESHSLHFELWWVNSILWSRALNLPLPHSYVFPQIQEDTETTCPVERSFEVTISHSEVKVYCINMELRLKFFIYFGFISGFEGRENDNKVNGATSTSKQEETVWVEGLLPGIDFCNHGRQTWEVPVPKLIVGSNKEWKPKVISSNFGKGSGTTVASDVPTSSVEANAHSQPVPRVLDSEEATSKL